MVITCLSGKPSRPRALADPQNIKAQNVLTNRVIILQMTSANSCVSFKVKR